MGSLLDEYRGSGPLRHLTVLDFSQMMMGPLATQLIGDLGALVIKVERPGVGEWERSYRPLGRGFQGESPYFLAMNRNKLSFTANLKDSSDRESVLALVERSDAVVHNFRPGVMERLGLGFEELRLRNGRIVFAEGSGWGARGPLTEHPGQDLLAQAMSGLAAASGPRGAPPVPMATPVCDASTGFLLAFAIVAAILDAHATGTPRKVNVSLLGTALLMQCQEAFLALNTDMRFERSASGVAAPWNDAPYGTYRASDAWLAIAMTSRQQVVSLFELPHELAALDADGWYERREEVDDHIRRRIAARPIADWLAVFAQHDVWAAPVLSLEEALQHPQVDAMGLVEDISLGARGRGQAVGMVTPMTGAERADRLPPPEVGEHNDVIRRALAS